MLSENVEGERGKEEHKLGEWLKPCSTYSLFNRAIFEDVGQEVATSHLAMLELYRRKRLKGKMQDLLVFKI